MSKLQEAVSKIRSKLIHSVNLADKLRIPAQHEHQSPQLPTDPDGIKTWLIAQGVINSAGAAKMLLRSLQHSNRTINTPLVRLQAMEQYEKPFAHAMQSLDTLYLYLDFPLQADAEKAFQLASTLCQEMAYGYKIALADQSKTKQVKLAKTKKCHAISRALEHLTQLALRHSQTYRNWPDDFWRDINALATIAIDERIGKTDINSGDKNCVACSTIIEQYARLCALHVIDRRQYKSDQLRTIFTRLTTHAAEIKFSAKPTTQINKSRGQNSQSKIYSVGGDCPPMEDEFRHQQPGCKLQYFSLAALMAKIESLDENNPAANISLHLNAVRKVPRAHRAGLITAETGLKEIHTLIKMAPPKDAIESQFTDITQLLEQSNTESLTEREILNSINTTDFGTGFIVENESDHGFGLRWSGIGSCKLQIGELIAHCYRTTHNGTSWHLGVVRWLSNHPDRTLSLGIESLTQHTNAVDVVRLIKGSQRIDTPSEALLINYQPIDSKAKMLVLPRHKYMAGETVGYRDDKGFHMVKLIESVDLAGSYQCFATKTIDDQLHTSNTTEVADYQTVT